MAQVTIRLVNEDKSVSVPAGTTLLEVQTAAGLTPDAPCGGQGTCGKCLVEVRRAGETRWRQVRACQTAAEDGMELRTVAQGPLRVLDRGESGHLALSPWVEVVPLAVPPCAAGESTADWSRLTEALGARLGRTGWQVNVPLVSKAGSLLRKSGGRVWAAVAGDQVLDLFPQAAEGYMAAFDLGTTSIAGYLLQGGEEIAQAGRMNPQVQFGADVISRANHALEKGPEDLARCAREALDGLLGELCQSAGIRREAVLAVSLVGNTCMHHLFLGISPASLVRSPYNPAVSEAMILPAADCGLHAHPCAPLLLLPVIAGFVGADTVGCLLAGDWDSLEELTLLIDIGTNGEIVLGNRKRMIACSTAAGPAFEGAKISCGMRGAPGAVDHVFWEDGQVRWSVIGGGEAKGLCGSGLIDLAALLRRTGGMDETGRLTGGSAYRLGDTEVTLSQRDIREMQLAKGAICAGIRLLAQQWGAALEDIRQVWVAGAFGSFMNPESACDIGLIPAQLRGKLRSVGNAAGEGAKRVLQSRPAWERAARLARRAEFLELASLPQFQDEFVDALEFPELSYKEG